MYIIHTNVYIYIYICIIFPGKFESSYLGRDDASREIGCNPCA